MVPIILTQQAWELLTTPGGADRVWSMALQDVTGNDLSPLCSSEGTCLTSSQTFDFEVLQSLFHKLSSINFCPCRELDFSARSAEVVLSTAAAFVRENIAYFKVPFAWTLASLAPARLSFLLVLGAAASVSMVESGVSSDDNLRPEASLKAPRDFLPAGAQRA